MHVIRIRQYEVEKEAVSRWSFWKHLKMIWENLKLFFTCQLGVNDSKANYNIVIPAIEKTLFDKAIVIDNGVIKEVEINSENKDEGSALFIQMKK